MWCHGGSPVVVLSEAMSGSDSTSSVLDPSFVFRFRLGRSCAGDDGEEAVPDASEDDDAEPRRVLGGRRLLVPARVSGMIANRREALPLRRRTTTAGLKKPLLVRPEARNSQEEDDLAKMYDSRMLLNPFLA